MNLKERLIRRFKKEFSEIKFKKVELITKGWDHDVLVLDNKFIFRFIKERKDKASFAREVNFLNYFGKITNLRIPKYTYLSKDKSFGGYEMIRGKDLSSDIYEKLSEKKKQKLIQELAEFVSLLHRIPYKKARELGFTKVKTWEEDMRENRKWFRDKFKPIVSKKLSKTENDFVNKFTTKFYKSKYIIKPTLGHYDLSHDHIIMNENGNIAGIIDFGDLAFADPAYEFNGFYDFDENLPKQIYKLYRGPKDKYFLKRSREHFMHRWIYLMYDGLARRKNRELWFEARKRINTFM